MIKNELNTSSDDNKNDKEKDKNNNKIHNMRVNNFANENRYITNTKLYIKNLNNSGDFIQK